LLYFDDDASEYTHTHTYMHTHTLTHTCIHTHSHIHAYTSIKRKFYNQKIYKIGFQISGAYKLDLKDLMIKLEPKQNYTVHAVI